jgi:hypothetical protein
MELDVNELICGLMDGNWVNYGVAGRIQCAAQNG